MMGMLLCFSYLHSFVCYIFWDIIVRESNTYTHPTILLLDNNVLRIIILCHMYNVTLYRYTLYTTCMRYPHKVEYLYSI